MDKVVLYDSPEAASIKTVEGGSASITSFSLFTASVTAGDRSPSSGKSSDQIDESIEETE